MSVYMIFVQDSVTDRDGLNAYSAKAGPTLAPHQPIPRAVSENVEHIEGDWKPGRLVMLEFESRERALAWYNGPEYSAVKGLRLAATSGGGGIMVEALKLPGQ